MTTEAAAQPAHYPPTEEEWDGWVSASKTRNFLDRDPILDWLSRHGRDKGFVPDDELPGTDQRTDMRNFVFGQGMAFENAVVALIRSEFETVRPGGVMWRIGS